MRYYRKYCGCLLEHSGRIVLSCKSPFHYLGSKIIYTPNGMDATKIKFKDLTGEDIAGIMFNKMTGGK